MKLKKGSKRSKFTLETLALETEMDILVDSVNEWNDHHEGNAIILGRN